MCHHHNRLAPPLPDTQQLCPHTLARQRIQSAERLVQLAVDMACDINCRMLSSLKGRLPEGYEESFREMAAEGLLPQPVAEKMLGVVALRRSLLYDSRPDLDEQIHRRLPFFAVLLREYGRSVESALEGGK